MATSYIYGTSTRLLLSVRQPPTGTQCVDGQNTWLKKGCYGVSHLACHCTAHTPHQSIFILYTLARHVRPRSMPSTRMRSTAMYELSSGIAGAATSAGEPARGVMYDAIHTHSPMYILRVACTHRMTYNRRWREFVQAVQFCNARAQHCL